MAAVLFSNAPSPNRAASSASANPPTAAPHKSFRQMVRASIGETLRTATRSKGKNRATSPDAALVANESGFAASLGLASSVARLSKEQERKSKDREPLPRPSTDTTDSRMTTTDRGGGGAIRRLSSRNVLFFKKSSAHDAVEDLSVSTSSRHRVTGSKSSFMAPSQSAASISSPALHLASDPSSSTEGPEMMASSSTSIRALISPPRARRPTVSSAGSSNSNSTPKKSSGLSSSRPAPSPPTLVLASSSKNTSSTTRNRRIPPSPSTPTLPTYPTAEQGRSATSSASPVRGNSIMRRSTDSHRPILARSPTLIEQRDGERSGTGSVGSGSGSDRSPSPPPKTNTARRPSLGAAAHSPSPPPRRSSADQRRGSFDHPPPPTRTKFGSMSTSHLPLGAAPSVVPSQHSPMRPSRADRHVPSSIVTTPSGDKFYSQRRNSSSASFHQRPSSPPSANPAQRTQSPIYRSHSRNMSTSSITGSTLSPQREALRVASTFIVKEMAKPPPAVLRASSTTSPYGGLAGAPAGAKTDPWDEVERRLAPLVRVERIWGSSSVGGGTISGGGEDRERRIFCEALRDGYVLAQLINKIVPTSPLPIPRVDPREDGISKTSNMLKFREAAKEYITMSGPNGRDLAKDMFGKDDLADGRPEAVARVSRVLGIIAALRSDPMTGQRRVSVSKERTALEQSVASGSGSDLTSSTATVTQSQLTRRQSSPTKKRLTPPSPSRDRATPELSSDSQGSNGPLERKASADRARRLAPSPSSPSSRPPLNPERRSSGSGQFAIGLCLAPPSPPPAPPRSQLRPAPSFASNRASVASSAQTDQTNLFEQHHRFSNVSNRFGTMRTIATEVTSIAPESTNGSWGKSHEDALIALGLADTLEAAAGSPSLSNSTQTPPPLRRKSYDFKNVGGPSQSPSSGLGLALQQSHHPPVSSADLIDGSGAVRPRRDRRSSEVAVAADLAKVLEESTTDMEGSVKPKPKSPPPLLQPRRSSADGGGGRTSSRAPVGLNLGKAKFPEDFVARFEKDRPSPSPVRPATVTPPMDDEDSDDPFLPTTGRKPMITDVLSTSPQGPRILVDQDATPKAKSPYSGTPPITIVTAASRQGTPNEEKTDPNALSPSASHIPFRRPTHRAGSQSVDVLLPRPTERRISVERRISMDRRVSADRPGPLLLPKHDRDSSSGSQDSPTPGEVPTRVPLRRSSTRRDSAARQAVYIPKRMSGSDDPVNNNSGDALLPAVASVPAVSHIRVPFPRSSSGEHAAPVPHKDADQSTPMRPSLARPRYQSELETPRLGRRGSSGLAMQIHRRESGENGIVRSRFDSMADVTPSAMSSSTNLARHSSNGQGSGIRRTVIVQEPGKAPMHYQLGNCIGKGQFGSVYRALNLNTGQMVAVKRISLEGLPETEVTQLMKEVELLKKLKHPSIVSYEGMARDEDSLDIVLEYVENGSLGQTLKAFGKFNEKLVATYVTKIIEGLHYLHEQKVVHRDLKAANILSTKNGNVKLSDFGVSLSLNAMENAMETHRDNVAGTPNWMAPEVIELKGATPASDIWSLGCTVVELLTGRPPYSDIGNSLSVMFRIVEDPNPPIPEDCSEPLRDFLSLCFKKSPAERPTAETLFEHPWLKRTWGLNKELRPEDSVPFLKRVSTDLAARQVSIQNLAEVSAAQERERALSNAPPPLIIDEPEFVVKPHSFVKTTFSKPVTCKVCHLSVKKSAVLCEECSLICHSSCSKDAPAHCDVRAQLLAYKQYSFAGGLQNGSPSGSTPTSLPSPALPSPLPPDMPVLSSSPSFHNKIFAWKRSSKTSTTDRDQVPPSPLAESRDGSQRRSGNLFFRRSEDRSRTRRDSMHGGSQNSNSTRSAATSGQSHGSTFRGRAEFGVHSRFSGISGGTSELMEASVQTTTTQKPATTNPSTHPVPSSPVPLRPSDATTHRRRHRKDSLAGSRSDCIIQ